MSEETKKTTKKELSLDEKVEAELKKEFEVKELEIVKKARRKQLANEKNKVLVKKAFDAGLTNAPAIGREIGMSENGVRKYALELGLQLTVTIEEKKRIALDAQRQVLEEVERAKFGLKE